MTLKNLVHSWCVNPTPLFRILNGNLQEKFIDPIKQHILGQGAVIRTNTEVKRLVPDGEQICRLELISEGRLKSETLEPQDVCVITTPLEVTCNFVDDSLFACEETNCPIRGDVAPMGDLNHLESAPMAAFQFYFGRKIPNIPSEHVNLYNSRFGLSFIDVSQSWNEFTNDHTVLSVIASDFKSLKQISGRQGADYVFEELRRFIPDLRHDDRVRTHAQTNVRTPLFLNTVGAWRFRPRTQTRIRNLYIAGDYCQSDADLTTMESAVISARRTAASILEDMGHDPNQAKPIVLRRPYMGVFVVVKWLLFPIALLMRLLIMVLTLKRR